MFEIRLTVASIEGTVRFYETIMGMSAIRFGADNARVALRFGQQKINLHEIGREFEPKAARPTAGSGDLCFVVDNFEAVAAHLAACGVEIIDEERAAVRSGQFGQSISVIPSRTLLRFRRMTLPADLAKLRDDIAFDRFGSWLCGKRQTEHPR